MNATVVWPDLKLVPVIRNGTVAFRYHGVVGVMDVMVGAGNTFTVNAPGLFTTPPSVVVISSR